MNKSLFLFSLLSAIILLALPNITHATPTLALSNTLLDSGQYVTLNSSSTPPWWPGSDIGSIFGGLAQSGNTMYGTATNGGAYNEGGIFSINADGSGYNIIYSFGNSGNRTFSTPAISGNTLYGITENGGTYGNGIIYSVNTNGGSYNVLYSFGSIPHDGTPWQTYAVLAISGNMLYGTTVFGGTNGDGTIFSINTNGGSYNVLYNFGTTNNGAVPDTGLAISGNTLYGTTPINIGNNNGVVFSIGTNGGGYNVLHTFALTGPSQITLFGNTLYGTDYSGGTYGNGIIFSIKTNGGYYNALYSFGSVANDGWAPFGVFAMSGNTLYGTTEHGGSVYPAAGGTVFTVGTSGGSYNVLHSFGADADDPFAGVILIGNTLYGTITGSSDGANYGTIFSINSNGGNYNTLHSFQPSSYTYNFYNVTSGSLTPICTVTLYLIAACTFQTDSPTNGNTFSYNVVAATPGGGGNANSVTKSITVNAMPVITISDNYATISAGQTETFTANTYNGIGPYTVELYNVSDSMRQGTNSLIGTFQGTTTFQIVTGATGTFTYDLIATDYGPTTNQVFNSTQITITVIRPPIPSLTLSNTLLDSGQYETLNSTTPFEGVLSNAIENYNTIYNFTDAVQGPQDIVRSGNMLYGMSQSGGKYCHGIIFAINDISLSYNVIYNFGGIANDGSLPMGLVLSGSTLYGTTEDGGLYNAGTVFTINTNGGGYNVLYNNFGGTWDSSADGSNPQANLTISGSTLYGTTGYGGTIRRWYCIHHQHQRRRLQCAVQFRKHRQ